MIALAEPRSHPEDIQAPMKRIRDAASNDSLCAILYGYYSLHRNLNPHDASEALRLLASAISRDELVGAASMLSVELELFLSDTASYSSANKVLIDASLVAEPKWSDNWCHLAWYMEAAGEWDAAAESWDRARANLITGEGLTRAQNAFESLFTGRLNDAASIAWYAAEARRKAAEASRGSM